MIKYKKSIGEGAMRYFYSALLVILLTPVFASSHVRVMSVEPADKAVLETAPAKVRISFLGSIEPAFSKIEVFDQGGKKVSKENMLCMDNDTVMEVSLQEKLPSGVYTVKWTCMSMDGHKQKGQFTFTVK